MAFFDFKIAPLIQTALDDFISGLPDDHVTYCVLPDHIHLLAKLPNHLSVNQFAMEIQTAVSDRLRQEGYSEGGFEWNDTYHAHSVSSNRLSVEKNLIERQEINHKEMSLKEELRFLGM